MSLIETAIMKIYIISHGENGEIVDLGDLDPLTLALFLGDFGRACCDVTKFARWQHPPVGRGTKFAVSDTTW